jgi:hypothetical protein
MFEKDDLCEKVDKKQCLKSLNSVNSEIDNEISVYEDKVNALEALICKYSAKTNTAEPLAIASIMYAVILTAVTLLVDAIPIDDTVSRCILLGTFIFVSFFLGGYYVCSKKRAYNNAFVLECLKFKYNELKGKETQTENQGKAVNAQTYYVQVTKQ